MDQTSILGWLSAASELRTKVYRLGAFDAPRGPIVLGKRETAKAGLSGKKRPRKFKGSKAAKRQSRKP